MWQIALIVAVALQWGTQEQAGWTQPRETREHPGARCAISGSTSPGNRYRVQENSFSLGSWQKLTETGSSAKLVRAVGSDSAATRQALQQWQNKDPRTVAITVEDASGSPVSRQTLVGAIPSKWSIDAMNAGASQVSVETLELSFVSIRC